jgi:hypothetical protein
VLAPMCLMTGKTSTLSNLTLQLGNRTLAPCFPPQQTGRYAMAIWRQLRQSEPDSSAVHWAREYSVCNAVKFASFVPNFLAPDPTFETRLAKSFIVVLTSRSNRLGSDILTACVLQVNARVGDHAGEEVLFCVA